MRCGGEAIYLSAEASKLERLVEHEDATRLSDRLDLLHLVSLSMGYGRHGRSGRHTPTSGSFSS